MGRLYAGILGSLAFVTMVARALAHGAGLNAVQPAAVSLVIFAAIGYVAGRLAEWIVEDSMLGEAKSSLASKQRGG